MTEKESADTASEIPEKQSMLDFFFANFGDILWDLLQRGASLLATVSLSCPEWSTRCVEESCAGWIDLCDEAVNGASLKMDLLRQVG